MITGVSGASSYPRTNTARASTTTPTAADALPDTSSTTQAASKQTGDRIDPSKVKQLTGIHISEITDQSLRDMIASIWLTMQHMTPDQPVVADNAPQNTYAQVKVGDEVVATLYNSGISSMSNATAAKVSELKDPPGLDGPDLAQWRAENYAKLLGGTFEKASTAITQSEWTPHQSNASGYSRQQLNDAFEAMVAHGRAVAAQNGAAYAAPQSPSGSTMDLSA